MQEFEEVFGAGGDVVDEEDCGVGGEGEFGGVGRGGEGGGGADLAGRVGGLGLEDGGRPRDGLDGHGAELGQLADAQALGRVQRARRQPVRDAELVEFERQETQDLERAVVRVALDDAQRAVLWPEEPQGLDHGPEQAREQVDALSEVEGEEVLLLLGGSPGAAHPEVAVASRVDARADHAVDGVRGVEDGWDEGGGFGHAGLFVQDGSLLIPTAALGDGPVWEWPTQEVGWPTWFC